MRDFREKLVACPPNPNDIADLLKIGQLAKALRKAKAAGLIIPPEEVERTAREMYRAGRAGELLALVGKVDIQLPYGTEELLTRTVEMRDYHSFLKHAHRLLGPRRLDREIVQAIEVLERSAPAEAQAWRLKFRGRGFAV